MTLAEWKAEVLAGIIVTLPMQDETYSTPLVDAYVNANGGWVPDSLLDPTGDGHLANSATPETAISEIVAAEYSRIYESSLSITLDLNYSVFANLAPNLNEDDIRAALSTPFRDMISDYLISKGFTVSNLVLEETNSTEDGVYSSARRVAMEAETPLHSVSAIALAEARIRFGLNNLWSISHAYVRDDSQNVAMILRKYTTLSFSTIDLGATFFYLIKVDPITKRIITGVKLNA